jgi:hypothetical protein
MTQEEEFIEDMKLYFDGGEAEAQYIYNKLKLKGWIK